MSYGALASINPQDLVQLLQQYGQSQSTNGTPPTDNSNAPSQQDTSTQPAPQANTPAPSQDNSDSNNAPLAMNLPADFASVLGGNQTPNIQTPDMGSGDGTPAQAPANGGDYYTKLASIESNNTPDAQNPNSSAGGTFQITDPTFQSLLQNHPELAGLSKNDPQVVQALTNDNAAAYKSATGNDPTDAQKYVLHFAGADGGTKLLQADPNTPVENVLSPQAIAANQFLQGKTAGQAIQTLENRFNNGGTSGPQNGGGNPSTMSPGQSLFPSTQSVYGPTQSALTDYIKSQPGMWDKLAQMQKDFYNQASQLTNSAQNNSTMNSFQQEMNAANAAKHATAGGILFHELPNPTPMANALQNAQTNDNNILQQKIGLLGKLNEGQSGLLTGQMAQAGQNIGLQSGLANQQAEYGLNTGKNALAIAQFQRQLQQQNSQGIADYFAKNIPNANTRAQVMQQFTTLANPNAPLSTNMQIADQLIASAQKSGLPLAEVGKQLVVQTPGNGGTSTNRTLIDTSNPNTAYPLPQGSQVTDPTAGNMTTNVGGESEGGSKQSMADQHLANITTAQLADTALKLQPLLLSHYGTGLLTDSPDAKDILNAARQLGYDPTNQSPRQLYDKIVNQLQSSNAMQTIKQNMGGGSRMTQSEFQTFMHGQLGPDADPTAAASFLGHVRDSANWNANLQEHMAQAGNNAKINNNQYYDPQLEQMRYQRANPPPAFDIGSMTQPNQNQNSGAPVGATMTDKSGNAWVKTPNGWVQGGGTTQ